MLLKATKNISVFIIVFAALVLISGCVNVESVSYTGISAINKATEKQIGLTPSKYGIIEEALFDEDDATNPIAFKLKICDDYFKDELIKVASEQLYEREIEEITIPPLTGAKIRQELDDMEITQVFHIMKDGEIQADGSMPGTVEIFMVFAKAKDGTEYLFYIG